VSIRERLVVAALLAAAAVIVAACALLVVLELRTVSDCRAHGGVWNGSLSTCYPIREGT